MFFGHRHHLIMPGDAMTMRDGWETRRRRDGGHDWTIVRLGAAGMIERAEVDTRHFKGNAPGSCSLDACHAPGVDVPGPDAGWREILTRAPVQPNMRNVFDDEALRLALHDARAVEHFPGRRRRAVFTLRPPPLTPVTIDDLNGLEAPRAQRELGRCCASVRWGRAMTDARPFSGLDVLLAAAERLWWSLEPADWLEAFAAHPRIGERASSPWAAQEQAGAAAIGADLGDRLARGNKAYEERFGYTFIVCATGKAAEEMLTALESRLENAPDDELQIAAGEQRRITELRLRKLLTSMISIHALDTGAESPRRPCPSSWRCARAPSGLRRGWQDRRPRPD